MQVERRVNPTTLADSLEQPAQSRHETAFIQQRWVEQMGHTADLADCTIDDLTRFAGKLSIAVQLQVLLHGIEHDLCSRQLLPNAIVQFTREPAPFFVLGGHQMAREFSQLTIQSFQLFRLTMKLGKHADLGPQQLRHYRNRNVVHGSALVSLQAIKISKVYSRDKNDGRPLESRMLPDHFGELESVHVRHADIHQHNSNIVFEQDFERIPG